MARRKKTVLLKTDLEEILGQLEAKLAEQTVQCDAIVGKLTDDKKPYYYGRRTALMELRDFISEQKKSRLD